MSVEDQQQQIRESVTHIAELAAKKAVEDVCLLLGIDVKDPIKTQAEFQAVRKIAAMLENDEVVDDLAFIRRLRTATDTIKDTTWKTVVRVLVTGALGIFLLGTKDWWLKHITG